MVYCQLESQCIPELYDGGKCDDTLKYKWYAVSPPYFRSSFTVAGFFTLGIGRLFRVETLTRIKILAVATRYSDTFKSCVEA